MELSDSNKVDAISVVSAFDEAAGDGEEVVVASDGKPHELGFTEFYNGTQYLLEKYNVIFFDYTNHISLTLNKLSELNNQIDLKKKSLRKRMRSAVETSEELSEKIRKIAEGAKAEVGEEEEEEEEEEEGEEEENSGEEGEDDEIGVSEENSDNEVENDVDDPQDETD